MNALRAPPPLYFDLVPKRRVLHLLLFRDVGLLLAGLVLVLVMTVEIVVVFEEESFATPSCVNRAFSGVFLHWELRSRRLASVRMKANETHSPLKV